MKTSAFLYGMLLKFCETIPFADGSGEMIVAQAEDGQRMLCTMEDWQSAPFGKVPMPAVEEVADAKKRFSTTVSRAIEGSSSALSTASPAKDKINFFQSLFCGRTNFYARRYYNLKTSASGYTPACANEWQPGLCEKPRIKCAVCRNRVLLPLDYDAIKRHLLGHDEFGRDVIGVYPLLSGDLTQFVVADFDDDGWQRDVQVFRNVCAARQVPAAVERSRSGAGAHVWFFFAEPVPAVKARRLASGLLTAAMRQCHELKFSSYDRLIPNQDTIPKGGFGNLIALPFQGQAQRKGNTLFVDEQLMPYPDQWVYLSQLPRMTLTELDALLQTVCGADELGELLPEDQVRKRDDVSPQSDADTKSALHPDVNGQLSFSPWEQLGSGAAQVLTIADFPPNVSLVLANQLYIAKTGLSQAAMDRIRRFGAFRNPDFYRSQAMRLPIYNKPRIISTAEETEEYIILGRGCSGAVTELLRSLAVPFSMADKRTDGQKIAVQFNGALREEQVPAAQALAAQETGVLSATTAFGKTVIGAWLIAQRGVSALVLVHTAALLQQWKNALAQFLTFSGELPSPPARGRGRKRKPEWIGQLGSGKNTLSGRVDVIMLQSLFEKSSDGAPRVKPLVQEYGMVLCDECHHVSAFSFEAVLKAVRAHYVYGLTATPTRQDGHQPVIFMQCGPIRYQVSARQQLEKQGFSHSILPRFTSARLQDVPGVENISIQMLLSDLCKDETRNRFIVADAVAAMNCGRTPIILTGRTEHARLLASLLQACCDHVFLLTGQGTAKEKQVCLAALHETPSDTPLVIVATGKYVGEGFDEPRLDTLLLAFPISWKGTLAQYAGRLHRSYAGKLAVTIYDYVDFRIPMLARMYQKRLRGYSELGYTVESSSGNCSDNLIFDRKNFFPIFSEDVYLAHHSLVVVSPTLQPSYVTKLTQLIMQSAVKRNGSLPAIKILTARPENCRADCRQGFLQGIKILRDFGCEVCCCPQLTHHFAVMDHRIVWYGDLELLSYINTDGSALRTEDKELARQLLALTDELAPPIGQPWRRFDQSD